MTDDQDRALWVQVKTDYEHARKLAYKIWGDDLANDPAACNAITATLLIHHKDLAKQDRVHVRVPAQAAVSSDAPTPSHAPAAGVPACPQCGGAMFDNREKKASGEFKPTSADFTCRDKTCKNEKGFRSGVWLPKDSPVMKKAKAEGAKAGVAAGRNFNEKPGPLIEEEDSSDLPF